MTSSMPRSAATASATSRASPVIMTTRTPARAARRPLAATPGRTSSSSASAPMIRPSRITTSTVAPRVAPCRDLSPDRRGHVEPALAQEAGPPTATSRPSTVARDAATGQRPEAGRAAAIEPALAGAAPRSRAPAGARCRPRRRPRARASRRVVDRRRRRRRGRPGSPFVNVPVLSNNTASTVRIRSSARRSLTSMPARAADARSRSR